MCTMTSLHWSSRFRLDAEESHSAKQERTDRHLGAADCNDRVLSLAADRPLRPVARSGWVAVVGQERPFSTFGFASP